MLCETNVLGLLIDLLKTHQEDDEIVLQIAFVFLVTLSHKIHVDYIVNKTGIETIYKECFNKNVRSSTQVPSKSWRPFTKLLFYTKFPNVDSITISENHAVLNVEILRSY